MLPSCSASGVPHARLRFWAGWATAALAGFFFVAVTAWRLFFSASIRLTTLGGVSTAGATISSPAILASMMRCSPSVDAADFGRVM